MADDKFPDRAERDRLMRGLEQVAAQVRLWPQWMQSVLGGERRIRKTGQFHAVDSNGRRYTILVYTEFIPTSGQSIEGLKYLTTTEGDAVNWIEKGHYRSIRGGVQLTSSDPAAP